VCEPVMVLWKNSFRTHWILQVWLWLFVDGL
jgi:hypothetical protein